MQSSLSTLSGEQIRAARALVRIDQSDLARRCGLSLETIKRLERIRGSVGANTRTLRALFEVFSAMGVAFDSCEDGSVGVCLVARDGSGFTPGRASLGGRLPAPRSEEGFYRLIYSSIAQKSAARPPHELLDQVQASGRQRMASLEVTGILFAYGGRILTALEGPRDNVRQLYGAIACDRRHSALSVISDQMAAMRHFPDWTVCCGLFASDADRVGDEPALKGSFHPEGLSPASALGLLSVMRDLTEASPRKALMTRRPCPLARTCLDRACAAGAAARDPGTSDSPPGRAC